MNYTTLSIRTLAAIGLVAMIATSLVALAQPPTPPETRTITVISIADNVHVVLGYDSSTMAMIEGDDGIVIIDTLGSEDASARAMEAFRAITDKPVKTLILTHRHRDHSGGIATVIGDLNVPIHQRAPASYGADTISSATRQDFFRDGLHDMEEPPRKDRSQEDLSTAPAAGLVGELISGRQPLQVAGLNLVLVAAEGENSQQLYIWYPEKGVLFSGDSFYTSFPAIHALHDVTRQTSDWIKTLDAMLLESPHFLVTSYGYPIIGPQQSVEALKNYRDTIALVVEETLDGIVRGLGPEELVESVQLPPELGGQPYLQEHFGKLAWAIRTIYADQRGWFDGNPTQLQPLLSRELAQRIADLSGGTEVLFENGLLALDNEDYRWAAQLADYLLSIEPDNTAARHLKADAMLGLAEKTIAIPARDLYLDTARQLRPSTVE